MKELFEKTKAYIKWLYSHIETKYALCAVVTVVFAEVLAGGAMGLNYPFRRPIEFVAASLLVFSTYTVALFLKKRFAAFLLIEAVWLGISIANGVLLSFRVNPLTASDFGILSSVFSIIGVYMSLFQIILILGAIALAIAGVIFCFIKIKPTKVQYKRATVTVAVSIVFCFAFSVLSLALERDSMKKMNLADAFGEYGFVYCFSLSTADRGIDRPEKYSEDEIDGIVDKIQTEPDGDNDDELPNIIFVQLESFMDPSDILSFQTSTNPTPNFDALKEAFPSGVLKVPVTGGSTVNTEFEVLCGMPITIFGLGEYPFETVLKNNRCESLAYYFKENGLSCHAIHNHTGTFYNRHVVYENLGFDTFTPVEFMSDVERNSLGWAKDLILSDEIVGAMKSTEGRDFVYAVSVQPHGRYSSDNDSNRNIKVSGIADEKLKNEAEFYVNEIYETDAFIGQLIAQLGLLGENTAVVFYGDHQPSLNLAGNNISSGSLYTTEYVIWNNFGSHGSDADLDAYNLGAYVLEYLGIDGGIISDLHQKLKGEADYQEKLSALSYDILFGEKYAYEGVFPYEDATLSFGYKEIKGEGAYIKNKTVFAIGEGFTECSVIFVDGRKTETIYINDGLVVCSGIDSASRIEVCQIAPDGYEFSRVACPLGDEATYSDLLDGKFKN